MDLPVCPSCRQSVLDDDVENCPFCGAPLKAGPKGGAVKGSSPKRNPAETVRPPASAESTRVAPKRPVAAAPAATPAKNSPAPARTVPSPPPPSIPDPFANDEAFPLDQTVGSGAIAASPKRTREKSYRVFCPMCDTVGYVPPSAAGKQVRCANAKCLMPVFTAPKVEKKAEEPAPPPPRPMISLPVIVIVICLLLLGGAYTFYNYFWAGNQPLTLPPAQTTGPHPPHPPGQVPAPAPQEVKVEQPAAPKEAPGEKPFTVEEVRDAVLSTMSEAARDERNERREFRQRLTAQAAAECGDLDTAMKFLDMLPQPNSELGFYRVPPLTSIAWEELRGGDKAGASKTLDKALEASPRMPAVGGLYLDSAAWLASALIASGRSADAHALVDRFTPTDVTYATKAADRLFAAKARAAAWNTFDIESADRNKPLLDVPSQLAPVVVEMTVSRGFPTEALQYAEALKSPGLRTESQIAWAGAVAFASANGLNKGKSISVEAVMDRLPNAARARYQARVGIARLAAHDRPGAEKALAASLSALGTVTPGKEFRVGSTADFLTLQLPDPEPKRMDALALGEIARLEGGLDKRTEAHGHLILAMNVLRASAPSPVDMQKRTEGFEKEETAVSLRETLKKQLKLTSDEVAINAVETCRKNCIPFTDAANSRFALQTEILRSALSWDNAADLWKEIGGRAREQDPRSQEPYFSTTIPWNLAVEAERAGDNDLAGKIRPGADDLTPPSAATLDDLASTIEKANLPELVKALQGVQDVERTDRQRVVLIAADRLVRAHRVDDALRFVRLFEDKLLKEDGVEWTAAFACTSRLQRPTRKLLLDANFAPTEKVCAWRGFLLGVRAAEHTHQEK